MWPIRCRPRRRSGRRRSRRRPRPTRAGVFGIARTTATAAPTADWSVSIRTPAAIDNTRVAPASRAAAAATTASGGLTARIADRHGTTSALTITPGKRRRQLGPPRLDEFDDAEVGRSGIRRSRSSLRAAPTPCCRHRSATPRRRLGREQRSRAAAARARHATKVARVGGRTDTDSPNTHPGHTEGG